MKHIKHYLITTAISLCCFVANAHDFEVDGIYYNITSATDRTVEVTFKGPYYYDSYNGYSGKVSIPSTVTYSSKTYRVTSIGDYAFRGCSVTSITIPKSVTSIGEEAFLGCEGLTSITIPESVTSIGDDAFAYCSSLTSITLPEGVTSIGSAAFYGCSSLTSITIPESMTSIGESAFQYCNGLTSITLPASVTSIGEEAFRGCEGLTSITIPENSQLTSIGYCAFRDCSSLTSITIPESMTSIGESAFQYCNGLTSITIPKSVTSIGEEAFRDCSNLTSITIPENSQLTSIGHCAFQSCSSLTSITLPASVTYIGHYVFRDCSSLTSIVVAESNEVFDSRNNCNAIIYSNTNTLIVGCSTTIISEDVTSIGSCAFEDCSSLTSITIPESVTSIGEYAFCDCSSLTSITIPASVTSIEGCAFSGCNSLAAITIPVSVTSIGWGAFSGCNSLAAITIPVSVASIEEVAFSGCPNLTSITIPASVTSIGRGAFSGCNSLAAITVEEGNTVYDSRNGCNAIIETSTNTLIAGCPTTVIPESVTSIGEGAFAYCDGLTSITIPENVTSIGHSAFLSCSSLTSITIPENVTSIGDYAFGFCSSLTSITCKSTTPPVCESSNTFYDVEKSIPVYVPASSISAYQAADYWKEFTNIQAIATDVLATSLTLDAAEASLAPDETLTLTATLLPEDATNPMLTWTSSNEKVATVDEYGVVTAVADGEATITVSTTDGSDLSATCVVTVETKEAEGDVTDYDNMIYFEDATAFVNTTVTLPLQMTNSASITAVQFDVYLPEGVTIEKTSRGKYNVTFNEDRADNTTHTLSSALQDDGAIRVLCYSTESYDFLGSEGAIFYFPLEIPEMEDGDYDVVIRNIVLTDVSGTKYEIPSMTSTMTVLNVAPGDCNADNTIDVADIVVLANHILGTTADGFVEKAADYNADGAVDVADIVNIANYILNGNHAGARALVREVVSTRAAAAGYSLDILPFVLEAEGSKTIALELTDPTESFTAFQCDLYLPEGISIETNNRGKYKFSFNEERTEAAYHTLSGSLQADGAVRMLCYSTDSEVFLGTEGALIYIPLTADASLAAGVYEFSIASTVLTYQDGVKVTPDTYKGSIVVGDGGEVQEVKLYGRYTSEVLEEYSTVLAANSCITSVDLTEAIYLPEDGLLTTGNPNTIVYLAEGDVLSNAYNVVTGDECAGLVLTDGYAFAAPVAFSASQASYGRELAEGKYGTIVLPFAPDTDDYVFYALTSAGDDVLVFDEVETPAANTPYLYKLRDGKSATQITNSEVTVSSELTPGGTAVWQMVGSYANRTIAAGEDGDRYYYAYTSSDNKIHRVTNTLTVKPYRAYFTTASTVGTQLAIRTRGGEETLIDVTEVDGLCPEVYYDLSGRRVDNPVEGVYIVNGKKVVF